MVKLYPKNSSIFTIFIETIKHSNSRLQ